MDVPATNEELLRSLAAFAGLPLGPERAGELATLFELIAADHGLLRLLPGDLEPHSIFDPRWD